MSAVPACPDRQVGDGDAERRAKTAALGEYFSLPSPAPGTDQPLATLVTDRATVRDFVDRTRSAIATSMRCELADIPLRVAASSFHLNVTSRLISPAIGAAVSFGEVPSLTLDSVRWQATNGHSPKFSAAELEWSRATTPSASAELISTTILATIAAPFIETLRSTVSLSTHVSWGNAISAANGAVTVLAMSRPDLEASGRGVVRALLNTGPLAGAGDFVGTRFVRRSCCLFYQAPTSGLCGDCVLVVSDGSHPPALG